MSDEFISTFHKKTEGVVSQRPPQFFYEITGF
jgi:hypothetical protein